MNGINQKSITAFFKQTKGEYAFSVVSFEKLTGERCFMYGAFEFFTAFMQITRELAKGNDVLLTDAAGAKYILDTEINEGRRVTYREMMPYAVQYDDNGNRI